MKVGEVAALLGFHTETIRRWAKTGKIPCYISPQGRLHFGEDHLAAIKALLEKDNRKSF